MSFDCINVPIKDLGMRHLDGPFLILGTWSADHCSLRERSVRVRGHGRKVLHKTYDEEKWNAVETWTILVFVGLDPAHFCSDVEKRKDHGAYLGCRVRGSQNANSPPKQVSQLECQGRSSLRTSLCSFQSDA
jgi:hypothetical protein